MISTFDEQIASRQLRGELRTLPRAYPCDGESVQSKKIPPFHSNNYLGLASHPHVIESSIEATRSDGCSSTGSRLLSGNLLIHEALETELAQFKDMPECLLFNSGYTANLSLLTALATKGDLIVSDKLNHASIIDGAFASKAEARFFRHRSLGRAKALLSKSGYRNRFLVTDAVFSMDGDLADLKDLIDLCESTQAYLILDEAHSVGVLGKGGRGIFEHFGMSPKEIESKIPGLILMGTLGKALGSFGAYVCTSKIIKSHLINFARPLVYSTALPPSVVGAAMGALEVIRDEPELLDRLKNNAKYLRKSLRNEGFDVPLDPSPIIPLFAGDSEKTMKLAHALESDGLTVSGIRPPTVPLGTSRIRMTVSALHKESDLDFLVKKIKERSENA